MKPLELIEEEMVENSELETPASECIDMTRNRKKEALSSNRMDEP